MNLNQKTSAVEITNAVVHITTFGESRETVLLSFINTKEAASYSVWKSKEELEAICDMIRHFFEVNSNAATS